MIEKKKLLVKRENYKCLEIVTGQQYSMPTESVMNLTNNFSVAFWFKDTNGAVSSGSMYFLRRYRNATNDRVWAFYRYAGTRVIGFGASGNGIAATDFPNIFGSAVLNAWEYYTVVFASGNAAFYKNGGLVGNRSLSFQALHDKEDVPLNCSQTTNKTQLQQLKYYNRVLSPNEIHTLYRQYPISRVGLVGEWDFNEKSGNVIYNTSQYGALLDGTTTGTREAVVW